MKTVKNSTNTRRSLRNTANGTKSDSPKNVKSSAGQGKPAIKDKSKLVKASPKNSPAKTVTPNSKRKRETEERPEEPPLEAEETLNADIDEGNDSGNCDTDETVVKPKARRVKKKKESPPEDELKWRPLDEFGEGTLSDENKKKATNAQKGDRRKQSLVERDIPCTVLVQTGHRPVPVRRGNDDSDCEVLDGANSGLEECVKNTRRNARHVDIDDVDVQSEAGSNFCEIIEEGNSVLDFKKLYALARRVHLPSTLWACHMDPLSHFVSFSRFNPDFSENSCYLVDRAVVFQASMQPIVYCNGEITTLPREIDSFETLTDVSHAVQHLNAMVIP